MSNRPPSPKPEISFKGRENKARKRAEKLGFFLRKLRTQNRPPYVLEVLPLAELQPTKRSFPNKRGRWLDEIEAELDRLETAEER